MTSKPRCRGLGGCQVRPEEQGQQRRREMTKRLRRRRRHVACWRRRWMYEVEETVAVAVLLLLSSLPCCCQRRLVSMTTRVRSPLCYPSRSQLGESWFFFSEKKRVSSVDLFAQKKKTSDRARRTHQGEKGKTRPSSSSLSRCCCFALCYSRFGGSSLLLALIEKNSEERKQAQ